MNPSKVDLSVKCPQSLAGDCIFQVISLKLPQIWPRSSDSLVWVFFLQAIKDLLPVQEKLGLLLAKMDNMGKQNVCLDLHAAEEKLINQARGCHAWSGSSELVFTWFRSQTYCDQLCREFQVAARALVLQQCIWAKGKASPCADLVRLPICVLGWCGQALGSVRLKKGGTAQVEFTLPAVARKRQGQRGRSQGKGCGYLWDWLQKAVSWEWGRKLLDFLGKAVWQ